MNQFFSAINWASTHSLLESSVMLMLIGVIIMYFRDSAAREKRIELYNEKIDATAVMLRDHMKDEEGQFTSIADAIKGLTEVIGDIKLTLVENRINRADVSKEQWNLVLARLDETAEITFTGAMMNVCMGCEMDSCDYVHEFGKLVQERRKESFHIWETAALPTSILRIIEEVDKELYPKVMNNYLPDITSICKNAAAKDMPIDVKHMLLESKIKAVKESVKRDWHDAISKRVNIT